MYQAKPPSSPASSRPTITSIHGTANKTAGLYKARFEIAVGFPPVSGNAAAGGQEAGAWNGHGASLTCIPSWDQRLHLIPSKYPAVKVAWFTDASVDAGVRYFSDQGFAPAGHLRFDPGAKWRDVDPRDLYRQGMGFEQEVEPLHAQIKAACPIGADGVLIAGTGLRCVAILEDLERDLKRPVLSANQASLWHSLRHAGVRTPVTGYGSLLRL